MKLLTYTAKKEDKGHITWQTCKDGRMQQHSANKLMD